nr:RNA-dependent RNA polymerase [Tolivirales sp.]
MGYEVGEFLIECANPHPQLFLKLKPNRDRKCVFVAVCHRWNFVDRDRVPYLAPLVPNLRSMANQVAAIVHRFGREGKPQDSGEIGRFVKYCKAFILHFKPVLPGDVKDFDAWLETTSYPGPRKKVLREVYERGGIVSALIMISASFLKDEGYDKPKMPRGINSYSDLSKTIFGPIFQAIDKKTFQQRWFVKGMDVSERPELLDQEFGNKPVIETDFTSFESHHRGAFSKVIWFWMMHMMRGLNLPAYLRRMLAVAVKGDNRTKFSCVTAEVPQTLMSGALWTSSSNGVLNLMIMSYLWSRDKADEPVAQADLAYTSFRGFIEGDDGITEAFPVDEEIITKLGIDVKLEVKRNYGCASFCGIVCPLGSRKILYNPKKFIRNFFWLPTAFAQAKGKAQDGYIRAKALSYLYNFSGCPVVAPICYEVCKRTSGYNFTENLSHHFDSYKWAEIQKVIKNPSFAKEEPTITWASRDHMANIFGITPLQQIQIENCFRAGSFVDLSDWMMPFDDAHRRMHLFDYEPAKVPWGTPHMPDCIKKIIAAGGMGRPSSKNERLIRGKWSV